MFSCSCSMHCHWARKRRRSVKANAVCSWWRRVQLPCAIDRCPEMQPCPIRGYKTFGDLTVLNMFNSFLTITAKNKKKQQQPKMKIKICRIVRKKQWQWPKIFRARLYSLLSSSGVKMGITASAPLRIRVVHSQPVWYGNRGACYTALVLTNRT